MGASRPVPAGPATAVKIATYNVNGVNGSTTHRLASFRGLLEQPAERWPPRRAFVRLRHWSPRWRLQFSESWPQGAEILEAVEIFIETILVPDPPIVDAEGFQHRPSATSRSNMRGETNVRRGLLAADAAG